MIPSCPPWILRGAAAVLATAYFGLAVLHAYWAIGGQHGLGAALPQEGGQAVLKPGRLATFVVALCLLACSALLLAWLHVLPGDVPRAYVRICLGMLAVIMLLRGIGDFRYAGLFRKRGDGRFVVMDTVLYTPMCIVFSSVLWLLVATD